MVLLLPKPRPIPDEFLKAIGLIAVEWTHLENTLGKMLRHLLGLGVGMDVVTTHIPFRTRIDIAKAYAKERRQIGHELVAELGGLLDKIDTKRGERNLYVHGEWGIIPTTGAVTVTMMTAHGQIKWKGGRTSVAQLGVLADEIVVLNEKLEALGWKLFASRDYHAPPSSP